MSTVPETIIARHEGMQVLGISCVTNLAAGISPHQLFAEEVIETGKKAQHQLAELFVKLAPLLNENSGR
jgi:purine-nucleoside phosphorylase